ncbi:MAG: citX [Clostridiaceae bacterium]|jgi:holo-ACP synthase|nr:citX [Clostridiaceae bacterium]
MNEIFNYNVNDIKKYSLEEILNEREKRVNLIASLEEKYNCTIIALRVNYPGPNKSNDLSISICTIMAKEILHEFTHYFHIQSYVSAEGPIFIMAVNRDSYEVKKAAVSIEDTHSLGRLVDIDVYNQGKGLSRKELNMPPRKCYICEDNAHNCARSKRHSVEEIEEFIKFKYNNFINQQI